MGAKAARQRADAQRRSFQGTIVRPSVLLKLGFERRSSSPAEPPRREIGLGGITEIWEEYVRPLRFLMISLMAFAASAGAAAAQDAAAGEKVFMKCKVCHQVGE